jgi:hypothetical protein
LEQNFSMPGSNSRQPILLGMLRPSPHLPSDLYRIQNSQTIITYFLLRFIYTA